MVAQPLRLQPVSEAWHRGARRRGARTQAASRPAGGRPGLGRGTGQAQGGARHPLLCSEDVVNLLVQRCSVDSSEDVVSAAGGASEPPQ